MKRSPIKRKRSKPRRGRVVDRSYREFIASLPCCVCEKWGTKQDARTEAAHVGVRGIGQKCSDRDTLPICGRHHRNGRFSHHVMGKGFWEFWGIVIEDEIAKYNRRYEQEMNVSLVSDSK